MQYWRDLRWLDLIELDKESYRSKVKVYNHLIISNQMQSYSETK
jgi:hypothetical protein